MKAESHPLRPEDLLEHLDWIRHLARALVGDPADADDLAQEAARVALDTPPEADRPVRPWLAGVLRNLVRMRARGSARADRRERAVADIASADHTADLVERVQMHRVISELVIGLEEPFRTAVLLRFYEGLSSADIARQLDIPAGTVRWRLKRALDTMRDELDARHGGARGRWCALLLPIAGQSAFAASDLVKGVIVVKTALKIGAVLVGLLGIFLAGHLAGWWSGGDDESAARTAGKTPGDAADAPPAAVRAGVSMRAIMGPDGIMFAAKDADPPGTLRLEGQVIDERDQPIGGAVVAIDSSPPRIATTEQDGSFQFDGLIARRYELEARAGERFAGPASVQVHAAVDPLILRAAVGARLRVMVRSASADEPVAGADVELRSTLSWSARTDGKGEAVLAGVGSGWRTLVVRATGYAPSSRMITSAQATPESRIVVQLERGAAVGGRVISPAGEPIAGARVWATSVSEPFPTIDPRLDAAVSDAKGRWQMPALPAGSFRFTAAHDAHSETTTAPHAFDGSTAKDDVVIKLEPGGTITGTVVDGGGKPVAGASVRATGVGRVFWGLARETIADEQGTFALSGLPRRSFELVARHADRASELVPADLTASGQAKVTLALAIDGAIAGTVVDSGGDPVADAQLFVEPRWSGSRDERSVWRSRGVPMASADREGSFRIGGLPRGTYRIHAARAGADIGLLQLSSGVEASPGDSAVRIVVPAHAVITGKVAFADGSAPGAFSVGVGPSLEMPFSTKHGRFSISAVAGKHNIIVSGPSILTRTVPDVEIAESDETDIGTITVERGRSVSGRVVDRDGVPVAGAKVAAGRLLTGGGNEFNIPSEGFDVQETQTDASGRFLLAGFDERSLVVVAQHDQRGRSSSIRVPASSVSANVELVLSPTGAVHGRVRKSGQPLAETVVIANTIGASQQNYFVVTGPDGSFAFDKLAAGEYTLSAMLGQGGGRPKDMHFRSVDVVAGQRKEVNVDIAEGPITLSVLVQSDDGKPVAIAQIFFGTGSFEAELTNFDQMRERNRFGDGIGAAYLRNQMMGAPAEIAGLVPGEYTACAMPIPADPRDQNAMQRMFSQADRLPVRCKALGRIETSPDRPFVITVPVDWTRPAS